MSCENAIAVGICPSEVYIDPETLPLGGIDYSTEEQWTGRRWIDGKKIYQRVYTVGDLPKNGKKQIPCAVTGIGEVINLWGFFITDDRSMCPFPCANPGTNADTISICYRGTPQAIEIWTGVSRNVVETYVTIQYTCTDR